jgi:hypothetical protein
MASLCADPQRCRDGWRRQRHGQHQHGREEQQGPARAVAVDGEVDGACAEDQGRHGERQHQQAQQQAATAQAQR